MLQLLISYFVIGFQKEIQPYPVAVLSVIEQYDNEHKTELGSAVGRQTIAVRLKHLLFDILSDGQHIFPFWRKNIYQEFEFSTTQRVTDE
jgi:hypothetical protein